MRPKKCTSKNNLKNLREYYRLWWEYFKRSKLYKPFLKWHEDGRPLGIDRYLSKKDRNYGACHTIAMFQGLYKKSFDTFWNESDQLFEYGFKACEPVDAIERSIRPILFDCSEKCEFPFHWEDLLSDIISELNSYPGELWVKINLDSGATNEKIFDELKPMIKEKKSMSILMIQLHAYQVGPILIL